MNTLNNNNLEIVLNKPMDNFDIKKYLPNVKIIKFSDFKRFRNIDELLPNNTDYCIVLNEYQPEDGHWTAILKYNNIIECFDSIFCEPEKVLKQNTNSQNKMLGQFTGDLKKLLRNPKYKAIYNKTKYQNDAFADCGRHCVFRIMNLIKFGFDLNKYDDYLKSKKKYDDTTFDEIVSFYIDKI